MTWRCASSLIIAMTLLAPLRGQGADAGAWVGLGRDLFSNKKLSEHGQVSCATCHDPAKSFIDGIADSRGAMDIGIGRNSPTLFGVGHLSLFRDPSQSRTAKPGLAPKTLSLEARCLAPMENELEMGSSPAPGVKALRGDAVLAARFDQAFGPGGVTAERLGKVLAAFVRSIEAPATPYGRWLADDQAALSALEQRGLAVFEGAGRCSACHSGPALSDGLMHVVDPPDGLRIRDRERASMERRVELLRREYAAKDPKEIEKFDATSFSEVARKRAPTLPGGGGYDSEQLEVQTTTLWDVARTAPYFRDGSAGDLRSAVKTHVRELAEVQARKKDIDAALSRLTKNGKRAPKKLRPTIEVPRAGFELEAADLEALLAFLGALSPR